MLRVKVFRVNSAQSRLDIILNFRVALSFNVCLLDVVLLQPTRFCPQVILNCE